MWLKKWWIDGVLWYNTLKAILDINDLEDWFNPTKNEVTVDNNPDKNKEEVKQEAKELDIDKFFEKKDAEKRFKTAVENWNKQVQRFQAKQKKKIEKAKGEYENLLAAGVIDVDKHIIKSK